MPGYGFWQGAERATGNVAATGMQLLQFQANKQIQEDKLNLLQEQAGRERVIFENQQKKVKEQEAIQDAIVPASVINPKFHESPRVRKQYIETLKGMGFEITETPDEVYAPKKAFDALGQMMKTKHDVISMAAENKILDLQDAAMGLSTQIQELTQGGKDDEKTMGQIQKLQAQKLAIHTQIAESMNLSKEVQKAIALEKAKGGATDEIREYNLAVNQGETRSFTEWKKSFQKEPASKLLTPEEEAQAIRIRKESRAPVADKDTPASKRMEIKDKATVEAALLMAPEGAAASAYAAAYNELSATDEYVFKPTGELDWLNNEKTAWVKQPKGGGKAVSAKKAEKVWKYSAKNKKGLKIFSDDGMLWKDVGGKVIK